MARGSWDGYLVEMLAGTGQVFLDTLQTVLRARNLPKTTIQAKTVNMWWKPNCPCLSIVSDLDGRVDCTVHALDYGTSLFIGISYSLPDNLYTTYKEMAVTALLDTVDRCAAEAIANVSEKILHKEPLIRLLRRDISF
jgi:hypothetical protein